MEWYIKKFNELTNEEIYEILKRRVEVFVVEQNCPYLECDDKDQEAIHFFLKDNNCIIAYLRVLPQGVTYDEISIGRVLVIEDYRGKGIVNELMHKAIRYIESNFGESNIRISAQEYLLAFYESLGFQVISDVYLEDGIPHLEMLYLQSH
ncbi:GNAT family N-acetyltransferase [Alkaliphilus peptidifermentans]|uniref:ElaA protein n=1 Tax=Alkaliphilus peptidifermentans DSM 18978 TaxID=1120976 RepID=A0A1G5FWZ1_9FIRM|nr:GNAT family N-acetyltransferase [Alkaliphilus peptidifermentans]SCY43669.1 ElaA protein [Alkaliphilus peptidifermentans DSM 18978]